MSTRNKARKSTGPRGAVTPNTNTSNDKNKRKRRAANSNFSLQKISSSSSESEAPTQLLNVRSHSTSPGPSGINRLTLRSSDSDPDGPVQRRARRPVQAQKAKIVQRGKSTSSSDSTTSDSDEIPGRESMEKEKTKKKTKRKKTAPKNRRIVRKPNSSSEADEVVKSSPLKRQSVPQPRNISSLVNKCVYFLLIADQKKHAIKKAEILKHVFNDQDKKLYGAVIEEANNVLKKTYGMEILTSEKRRGEYILINILNRDLGIQDFVELSPLDLQKRGLVFYLLTVIFMNEKSINENELWEALKPLGIDATSRLPHPIFGDVRKYLTNELVKQMYLEHKCISRDPPEFEFTWGERAKQEIDKKDLLEFACKIMGDTKPEEWILQYNDAMHAEADE